MTDKKQGNGNGGDTAQIAEAIAEIEALAMDDMADESTVTIGDRVFELGIPATKHVIWFINVVSRLVRRSQGLLLTTTASPGPLDLVFSLAEALNEDDLIILGVAALQFDNKSEGRKFLVEHGVPMAEIVQAVGISLKKSGPLVEQLKNVLESLVGRGTIEALVQTAVQDSMQ